MAPRGRQLAESDGEAEILTYRAGPRAPRWPHGASSAVKRGGELLRPGRVRKWTQSAPPGQRVDCPTACGRFIRPITKHGALDRLPHQVRTPVADPRELAAPRCQEGPW